MVRLAERARAAVWVSPFSARCSFPGTASAVRRLPSRFARTAVGRVARTRSRRRDRRAGVHLPCRRPRRRSSTARPPCSRSPTIPTRLPSRRSATASSRTMKPALAMLAGTAAGDKTRGAGGPHAAAAPAAADPIPVEYLLHSLSAAMGPQDAAGRGSAFASPGDAKIHADARAGQFLHHGERRPRLQPAGRGRHRARPARIVACVCLIGDGSAMYSIQALWTAAQRKLPLTVVVINNSGYGAHALVQPGDAGAQRAGARAARASIS